MLFRKDQKRNALGFACFISANYLLGPLLIHLVYGEEITKFEFYRQLLGAIIIFPFLFVFSWAFGSWRKKDSVTVLDRKDTAIKKQHELDDATNMAEIPATGNIVSWRGIVFWRHIVGMVLVVIVTPPYVTSTPSAFLGTIVGTLIIPLLITTIIVVLGWLFFTARLVGKKGSLFIIIWAHQLSQNIL